MAAFGIGFRVRVIVVGARRLRSLCQVLFERAHDASPFFTRWLNGHFFIIADDGDSGVLRSSCFSL